MGARPRALPMNLRRQLCRSHRVSTKFTTKFATKALPGSWPVSRSERNRVLPMNLPMKRGHQIPPVFMAPMRVRHMWWLPMNRLSGALACCRLLGNAPAPKPVGKPALRPRGFMGPMRVPKQVGASHEPLDRPGVGRVVPSAPAFENAGWVLPSVNQVGAGSRSAQASGS